MIVKPPSRLLAELMEALTQGAGGAGQLGHHHRDARFFIIRDTLETIKDRCAAMATLPLIMPLAPPKDPRVH